MISDKIKQEVQIIHGDINQKQREATIEGFKNGKFKCLVATDVASRGLDIPMVDLVIQSEPPKEVDSYIHRAGRTARAGRTGTCITLYTKFTEDLIRRIENKAKISFKKIGAPQRNELIDSTIRDVTTSCAKIDESVIGMFGTAAKKMIEDYGAENTVARLLAYASGHTEKMKSRSLLCGAEGFLTYSIKMSTPFQHSGFIWTMFKRIVPEDTRQKIKGLRQAKTMDECVFDFPEEGHDLFEEMIYNDKLYGRNYTISKCETLPELVDLDERGHGISQGPFRNTNQTNGNNNSRSQSAGHFTRSQGPAGVDRMDIFIGNLSSMTQADRIKTFLDSQGVDTSDTDIRLVNDKETGSFKGFGFISTFKKDTYNKILTLNGKMLANRALRINDAKNK
jgi:ATP-dependent RNA helicase DDX21